MVDRPLSLRCGAGRDGHSSAVTEETASSTALGRRHSIGIALASFAGALSGYVVLAVVARIVPLEQNTVFVTFWSALLTLYGVLTGVNTETARAVAAARVADPGAPWAQGSPGRSSVDRVLVVIPLAALVVGLLFALFGAPFVFPGDHAILGYVVGISGMAYSVEAVLLGALSGKAAWGPYATLLALEALARLVLVGVAALIVAAVDGLAAAAAAATLVWVLMLVCSPTTRRAARSPIDVELRGFLGRVGVAAVAAGSSGILLVGFPVLVSLTTDPVIYATAAPLMLGITLTRAPIMVPLTAFQSVIVSWFVRNRNSAGAAIVKLVAVLLAVGVAGGLAAWWLGPWILQLLFGPEYQVSGFVLAAMTLASAGTAIITVTGALAQSLSRHGAFVAGWLLALAITIGILLSPGSMEVRVVVALVAAPYVGAALHAGLILRTPRAKD